MFQDNATESKNVAVQAAAVASVVCSSVLLVTTLRHQRGTPLRSPQSV